MRDELHINAVTTIVTSLIESDPDYFLVEIRMAPGNHIKVFADGDQGISIDKCVALNRSIYKKIEESAIFPDGDFSLEVSSPGLDEPLKLLRQYKKNLGRIVEVVLTDGSRTEGRLVSVSENDITLEEAKGKKKEIVNHTFTFENIKTIKVQVVF